MADEQTPISAGTLGTEGPMHNQRAAPLTKQTSPAAAHFTAGKTLTVIEAFDHTPFPYDGPIPDQAVPFLDAHEGARKGHTSPRGGVYWEDKTYADKRVLLSVPAGFTLDKPVRIILFLHGNEARLDRDVRDRQHVPRQVAASKLNAVLVAPQFAVDALDSSAGHFWEQGFLREFLTETAVRVANLTSDPRAESVFDKARVVIVAYSGGYLPAAYALQRGGARERLEGVILLDALYAEEQRIADWVENRGSAFFFSAYSPSTLGPNTTLQRLLRDKQVATSVGLPETLGRGSVTFLPVKAAVTHRDFVSRAWTVDPMRDILSRIDDSAPTPAGER